MLSAVTSESKQQSLFVVVTPNFECVSKINSYISKESGEALPVGRTLPLTVEHRSSSLPPVHGDWGFLQYPKYLSPVWSSGKKPSKAAVRRQVSYFFVKRALLVLDFPFQHMLHR